MPLTRVLLLILLLINVFFAAIAILFGSHGTGLSLSKEGKILLIFGIIFLITICVNLAYLKTTIKSRRIGLITVNIVCGLTILLIIILLFPYLTHGDRIYYFFVFLLSELLLLTFVIRLDVKSLKEITLNSKRV